MLISDKYQEFIDESMSFGRAQAWGLVSSTPQKIEKKEIITLDVYVTDGSGSRSLEINSGMTLIELLNAVSGRLGGRSLLESLAYETPAWSRKIGTNKYVPHYLDSQVEVDKFFERIHNHREEQKRLKKTILNPDISLIVSTQVALLLL